jgi:UDP-3-O-[3-hydroxymyristoyl] glucosamine N-acyltransferase
VVIGDWVEIGALSTVSSGTIDPTRIASFTKLDDHVHIAHNCQVGSNTIITAGAVVAGSVIIGDGAWLGPNCTITDGVTIGEGAFIGIGAVVLQDCQPHGVYSGNPARKYSDAKPR